MSSTTYKSSGVDIDAADKFLKRVKVHINSTKTPGVLADIGHFGAFFRPDISGMKEPVLTATTDGVGTKLKIAFITGVHNTVGQDLVNHCVNDLLCTGAQPLFFQDYLSMGKLDEDTAVRIIEGICTAAKANSVAVIGGETAEMPGIYQPGEYDLAGTMVGIVDRSGIIDGSQIEKGDMLIGLPSNGLHTNGYSLARKIVFDIKGFTPKEYIPELNSTIGEELLRIHRSYLKPVTALKKKITIKGISHITGGGIIDNTMRIIPRSLELKIDWRAWEVPPVFRLLQEWGEVKLEEMRAVFNIGVGLILIIASWDRDEAVTLLKDLGEKPFEMGVVE